VDLAEAVRSFNTFDLLVVLVMFALFILGFIQGTIRRLLGIASILFSFLLAAQLREPLGGYLAANWRQFPAEYAVMLGFGFVFVLGVLVFSLLIQSRYTKVPLFEKYTAVDEVLGGVLGIVQGTVLLGAGIVILDSFFQIPAIGVSNAELPFLRSIYLAYDGSGTAELFRFTLIPSFLAVTGPLVPPAVKLFFAAR
jgi:uncharacterized membrane protein required for colicin V production